MDTASVIIAQATPQGQAHRALIRLSGPGAIEAVGHLAHEPLPQGRGVGAVRLRLPVGTLAALAVRMPGPHSYTGEDTVELLVPGSPAVVGLVLEALLAHEGVRMAEPGEFSARAYLHGRLSIEQAEGVAARIAAVGRAELHAADRMLAGEGGARYRRAVEELADLLALVEAGCDFSDQEDVTPISPQRAHAALTAVRDALAADLAAVGPRPWRSELPLVVLSGYANTGKTTLFNALLGRTRAVASPRAHTTRDAIIERAALPRAEGPPLEVELADLPGLDTPQTPDAPAEAGAPEAGELAGVRDRALDLIARASVVVSCDDRGRPPAPELVGRTTVLVRTKADKPWPAPCPGVLEVSARAGVNLVALCEAIAAALSTSEGGAGLAQRHARLVERAVAALDEALATLGAGGSAAGPEWAELVAAALREAIDALGELGGRVGPDEVLGRIFASFCVGK